MLLDQTLQKDNENTVTSQVQMEVSKKERVLLRIGLLVLIPIWGLIALVGTVIGGMGTDAGVDLEAVLWILVLAVIPFIFFCMSLIGFVLSWTRYYHQAQRLAQFSKIAFYGVVGFILFLYLLSHFIDLNNY